LEWKNVLVPLFTFLQSAVFRDCESSIQATRIPGIVFNPSGRQSARIIATIASALVRLTSVYRSLTRRLNVIASRENLTAVVVTFVRARLLSLETHRGIKIRRERERKRERERERDMAVYGLFKVNAPCNLAISEVLHKTVQFHKYVLKSRTERERVFPALMPAEDTLTMAIKRIEYKVGCVYARTLKPRREGIRVYDQINVIIPCRGRGYNGVTVL